MEEISSVKFPVIKRSPNRISAPVIIIVILLFASAGSIMIYKNYLKYENMSTFISSILFLLSLLVILLLDFIFQRYKYGGELTISDTEIIINSTNHCKNYPLSDIIGLKMNYSKINREAGIFQRIGAWLFGKSKGMSNFIEFHHQGEMMKFEIYIKGKDDAEKFIKKAAELQANKN